MLRRAGKHSFGKFEVEPADGIVENKRSSSPIAMQHGTAVTLIVSKGCPTTTEADPARPENLRLRIGPVFMKASIAGGLQPIHLFWPEAQALVR